MTPEQLAKLLVTDEKRVPVVVEHNDLITDMATVIVFVAETMGTTAESANFVKTVAESLFYHGYQAGRDAVDLDDDVWGAA